MKGIKCLLLFGMLAVTVASQANYDCTSYFGKQSKLTVEENQVTPLGDTVVVLESEGKKKYLFGTMILDGGGFLKKKVVEFNGGGDTLTLVSQPKQCGRGSCDFLASSYISGTLVLGDTKTKYTCND